MNMFIKNYLFFIILIIILIYPCSSNARELEYKVKKVIIDPGHGGFDPGAVSKNNEQEKNITLLLAKSLDTYLKSKNVTSFLTRDDDYFLDLSERIAISNRFNADLFISIHINSSEKRNSFFEKNPEGIEIYYCSKYASDKYAQQIAERENALGINREIFNPEPGFFDFQFMIQEIERNYFWNISRIICEKYMTNIKQKLKLKNRGIKYAPFFVLRYASMPAILIEVGFINNPKEVKYIKSKKFIDRFKKSFNFLLE